MSTKKELYGRADAWSRKARREGYPARSVYKLEEIAGKFNALRGARRVLDLGAAPGSWTCWLLDNIKEGGKVVAVDLKPLEAGRKALSRDLVFFQGDMQLKATQDAVIAEGPYDAVLSDAAPNTSGSAAVDTALSAALAESALWIAARSLKEGGFFCAKIFQGGRQQQILESMKGMFEKARCFKPKACRKESFETYLIGLYRRQEGDGKYSV